MTNIISDYWHCKRVAVAWARIAIDNKRDGIPWHQAAKNAHDAIRFALLII
jgi:hypothetical protein